MEENDKIKEAMEELEKISQDESLRRIAELKEKYILDESSARRYYKEQGLAEGRAEGLELGKQEGLELGRAEGRAEGKAEQKKEIITIMLKNGMSKEQISSFTGISVQEIDNLLK